MCRVFIELEEQKKMPSHEHCNKLYHKIYTALRMLFGWIWYWDCIYMHNMHQIDATRQQLLEYIYMKMSRKLKCTLAFSGNRKRLIWQPARIGFKMVRKMSHLKNIVIDHTWMRFLLHSYCSFLVFIQFTALTGGLLENIEISFCVKS